MTMFLANSANLYAAEVEESIAETVTACLVDRQADKLLRFWLSVLVKRVEQEGNQEKSLLHWSWFFL